MMITASPPVSLDILSGKAIPIIPLKRIRPLNAHPKPGSSTSALVPSSTQLATYSSPFWSSRPRLGERYNLQSAVNSPADVNKSGTSAQPPANGSRTPVVRLPSFPHLTPRKSPSSRKSSSALVTDMPEAETTSSTDTGNHLPTPPLVDDQSGEFSILKMARVSSLANACMNDDNSVSRDRLGNSC